MGFQELEIGVLGPRLRAKQPLGDGVGIESASSSEFAIGPAHGFPQTRVARLALRADAPVSLAHEIEEHQGRLRLLGGGRLEQIAHQPSQEPENVVADFLVVAVALHVGTQALQRVGFRLHVGGDCGDACLIEHAEIALVALPELPGLGILVLE